MEKDETDAESHRPHFPEVSSSGGTASNNDEVYGLPLSANNIQSIARQLGSLSSRTALSAEDEDMSTGTAICYILRGLLSLFNSIAVSSDSALMASLNPIHLEGLSIHVDL
jgi:hypothetical protein